MFFLIRVLWLSQTYFLLPTDCKKMCHRKIVMAHDEGYLP